MKEYSLDETLSHLREMPESVRLDDVLTMALAAPAAVSAGLGTATLFAKFLHVKYLIPMFFTITTAGLALWYGLQTASLSPASESKVGTPTGKDILPNGLIMSKENPLNAESLRLDTTKRKKKVIREERRIRVEDGKEAPLPPLPELPALAPTPANQPEGTEVQEHRIVRKMKKGGKNDAEHVENDAFTDALLDFLEKENLLKNREKFSLSFTPSQLTVDGVAATARQLKSALDIFEKTEKMKFGTGSSISISRDKNRWSVSKSIESD